MLTWVLAAAAADRPPGDLDRIEDLDLRDLLDLGVDVTTRSVRPGREAPGLVAVLTAEDLARAGCRDLADALRLLPGLELGADVWGAVGLQVRGGWGYDGRALVLVDGHELNETAYGSVNLGNRLPAAAIERIEVVTGPGSALHGGYASLAVVKVTTRGGGEGLGQRADLAADWFDTGAYARRDAIASAAVPLGDDGRLGVTGVLGQGRRSDDAYTDVAGRRTDLRDASALDPALLSVDLRTGPFTLAVLGEDYRQTQQDGYDRLLARPHQTDFPGAYVRAGLDLRVGRVTLRPAASTKWQVPFLLQDVRPSAFLRSEEQVTRSRASLEASGQAHPRLALSGAAEVGSDTGRVPASWGAWYGASNRVAYAFGSAWGQGIADLGFGTVTAGLRYDVHSAYGDAFSPRVALTHAVPRAHYKLLVSRAFRAPGIEQARDAVDPERTTVLEAELGAGPTRWSYLTAQAWNTRISGPLTYRYTLGVPQPAEGYTNGEREDTVGAGLALDVLAEPARLSVGWSAAYHADAEGSAHVGLPDPPGWGTPALGVAAHKGVARLTAGGRRTDGGLVLTALAPRWAITSLDASGAGVAVRLPAALLVDVSLAWRPTAAVTLRATAHDLLDQTPAFVQPYPGNHAPVPSSGRTLGVVVTVASEGDP